MEYFWKSYWAMNYLALSFPGLQNIFLKICKTLRPLSYILHEHSLKYVVFYIKIYPVKYIL